MEGNNQPMASKCFMPSRILAWVMLLVLVLITFAVVFIPFWVIQPFKSQSPQGLDISYILRRWSPLGTLISSAIGLMLVVSLWRRTRKWWRKLPLILA